MRSDRDIVSARINRREASRLQTLLSSIRENIIHRVHLQSPVWIKRYWIFIYFLHTFDFIDSSRFVLSSFIIMQKLCSMGCSEPDNRLSKKMSTNTETTIESLIQTGTKNLQWHEKTLLFHSKFGLCFGGERFLSMVILYLEKGRWFYFHYQVEMLYLTVDYWTRAWFI